MKTFYSAQDIETLAGQGVRELIVDADTVLTAVAQEAAAQLGVSLVTPDQRRSSAAALPTTPAITSSKPRGCQHGGATSGQGQSDVSNRGMGGSTNPVVDDLIGAVKQLVKQG